MTRPKDSAPRGDTDLVSFRLSRVLVAKIDERASVLGGTRTDGTRDLLERGLASLAVQRSTDAPVPHTVTTGPGHPKGGPSPRVQSECGWCGAPRKGPHHEKCPVNPGSGLNTLFRQLGT